MIFEIGAEGGELLEVIDQTEEGVDLDALAAWGKRCDLSGCPAPPAGWSFVVEACDA